MENKYIIFDSLKIGQDLSKILFKLGHDDNYEPSKQDGENYVFTIYHAQDGSAIAEIPEGFIWPVFQRGDFSTIMDEMAKLLNGNLTPEKGSELVAVFRSGQINVYKIASSILQEISYKDFIEKMNITQSLF